MNFKKNYLLTVLLACCYLITSAENKTPSYLKSAVANSSTNADLRIESSSEVTIENNVISTGYLKLSNIGDVPADSIVMGYYLSLDMIIDDEDYLIGQSRYYEILPSTARFVSASLNISNMKPLIPAGDYYIGVLLDKNYRLDESDESNNVYINDNLKFTVTYGCGDAEARNYNPVATYFNDLLCTSCNDGIKNGNEAGIDCGGDCPNKCIDASANCKQRDREVLKAIYNSIDLERTDDLTWNLNEPFENWEGVVFNEDGCVVKLKFIRNHLKDYTPSEIGKLSELKRLDLYNYDSGDIPASIGNLSKLDTLNMGGILESIPSSLANLTNLTYLRIHLMPWFNRLNSIPSFISKLSNLKHLDLSQNEIDNSIPDWLGNLTQLEVLLLNDNRLHESIPESLSNLAKLRYLSLHNNNLTGSIPASIGNLPELNILYLYSNKLTGSIPSTLGNLTNLKKLDFFDNDLSGNIPATFGNLASLETLHLSSNNLSGAIPGSIGNLANLQVLSIMSNNLSYDIPASLGNLTNLERLRLNENNLSGNIPASLGNLSNLTQLYLLKNQLSGCIPNNLYKLCKKNVFVNTDENLSWKDFCDFGTNRCPTCSDGLKNGDEEYIDCGGSCPDECSIEPNHCKRTDLDALIAFMNSVKNGPFFGLTLPTWLREPFENWEGITYNEAGCVEGLHFSELSMKNLPTEIGELKDLKKLVLDKVVILDSLPTSIGNLINLDTLRITTNYIPIKGSISAILGNLVNLKYLNIPTSGPIPESIKKLKKLEYLNLHGKLTGTIPVFLENLSNLEYLNLAGELTGTIPAFLSNMINLKVLKLFDNNLSGDIPASLSNLINLEELDFRFNKLSGYIPVSLGNLSNLKELILSGNKLSGYIPASLGNLSNLKELKLYRNELTGSIPASFSNLVNLKRLDLASNQLSGCFPDELLSLCEQDILVSADRDNNFNIKWSDFCNGEVQTCIDNDNKLNLNQAMELQNYPNPFKTNTTIEFELPTESKASVKVYNALGKQIAVLIDEATLPKGKNAVNFNGSQFSAGIYYYSIKHNDSIYMQKMTLMK